MSMIIKAIEDVGVENADGSLTIDRGALRDAFFAITDFPGITGSLTCNELGDCADPKISVGQVARISEVGADNCGATSGDVCFNRIWP